MTLERVGFIVHSGRQAALSAAEGLIGWMRERGVVTRSLAGEMTGADEERPAAGFPEGLDLVVSVGGDGTLLRAAQLAAGADTPVLGVKVGRLGFLTELDPEPAPALLAQILDGQAVIEERMALVAEPRGAPWSQPAWALNEVIVEKRARHRLITLRARIRGEHVTTFSADGGIVATPTGSTAYSFSVGGPIVSPRLECLLLTPVSPHMVFDRTIVVPADEPLELEVVGDEPGLLSADGRPALEMPIGSSILVRKAHRGARLVRRPDSPSFFSLVREKFALPGHGEGGANAPRVGPGG